MSGHLCAPAHGRTGLVGAAKLALTGTANGTTSTIPGQGQSQDKHQPPDRQHNAVWAMNENMAKLRTGTDEEKAIALTWLWHLIGDIRQPLHEGSTDGVVQSPAICAGLRAGCAGAGGEGRFAVG